MSASYANVPSGGVLSFWVYQGSNEGQLGYGTKYAWQAGYLLNSRGSILTTFYKTVNNTNGNFAASRASIICPLLAG